jgi:RNA polymerase sigma-70 factor (ECF subfamily)
VAVPQTNQRSLPAGKVESIEELFAALESPLLGYALRLVADRATAEELVQEAFMKLHAHFQEVEQPRRWLYRTVHNLALNHQRHTGKIVSLTSSLNQDSESEQELVDPQPLPDEQIAHCEAVGLVRLSLGTLDERSREVVRLKFNENLRYSEIAERLGLTAGHVGYLLHHALKAVAAELSRSGALP